MMGNYSCTLWRDRSGFLGRLLGPKKVDVFDTGVDPEDPRALQAALITAVDRNRSQADITQYRLEVVLTDYRYAAWLDGGG